MYNLQGFDNAAFEKFFRFVIFNHDFPEWGFISRAVAHNDKGNNPNASEQEKVEMEAHFKEFMALLYFKTFYGKNPSDFKTEEYQKESEKFNKRLKKSSNKELRKYIEESLKTDHIDYTKVMKLLYDRFFYAGLSSDDGSNTHVFFESHLPIQVRIYINPSQKDYGHLMEFLFKKAAENEIYLRAKTRMADISEGSELDNLILYTSNEDFVKVIEILKEYENLFPDKVKDFGGSIEALNRLDNDWFGFGFEGQRGKISGNTFNCFIDCIFNNYIFPVTVLNDFEEVMADLTDKELADLITEFKNEIGLESEETAKDFIEMLFDTSLRNLFLKNFCDLSYVTTTSNEYTEQNKARSSEEILGHPGYTACQMRPSPQQTNDEYLLKEEKISVKLKSGRVIKLSRGKISKVLYSRCFRNRLYEYHTKNPNKMEREVRQMRALWRNVGKCLPYLDSKYPSLTPEMAEALGVGLSVRDGENIERNWGYNAVIVLNNFYE